MFWFNFFCDLIDSHWRLIFKGAQINIILSAMDQITMCNVKEVTHCDKTSELLPMPAVPLSSTESSVSSHCFGFCFFLTVWFFPSAFINLCNISQPFSVKKSNKPTTGTCSAPNSWQTGLAPVCHGVPRCATQTKIICRIICRIKFYRLTKTLIS